MSGRRRKETPSGDGGHHPPSSGEPMPYDDPGPFAPRPAQNDSPYTPTGAFNGSSGSSYTPSGSFGGSSGSSYGAGSYGSGSYGSEGSGASGPYGSGSGGSYGSGGNGASGPYGSGSGGGGDTPSGAGSGGEGGGRRRAPRKRTLGTLIGPLAAAIGLAILLGAGVYALADSNASCGGSDAIDLKVAAAPDIAPAITQIVGSFNKDHHSVGGKCVKATVHAADPADTTALLSGQGSVPGEVTPDVWIPDSSLWIDQVRGTRQGAARVNRSPTSVADTPILVATTKAMADQIHKSDMKITWDMLLKATQATSAGATTKNDMLPTDSVKLQVLDPVRNAGGLGAIVMTRTLLESDPNATPIFTQIVRSVQNSTSPNTQALFGSFKRDQAGRTPMAITPEQSVWKYNQTHHSAPAVALYPAEGAISLDYPFALATQDDNKLRGAALLEKAMGSPQAQAAVHSLGFRTPDGKADEHQFTTANGLSPRLPRKLPDPTPSDVTDILGAWAKLSLKTRMLTLLDVSGSMSQAVGPRLTRMQATAQVAQQGLGLFPRDSDVGLWTFSTNMDGNRPYKVNVPLGPLDTRVGSGTRRQAILASLAAVRPKPSGNTGLYDSVLAAVRSMQKDYRPNYYNTLLVLTDGKNDNQGGMSLKGLLKTMRKEYDSDHPIMTVFIGFGPDVDMAAMQKIAQETNGAAYHANKPQEVAKFFLDSVARRICAPNCPKN